MQDVTPEILLDAYAIGVFPMAPDSDSDELRWYLPEERGILPLNGLKLPRRLMRTVRGKKFSVTADRAFVEVMQACAAPAPGREETWISPRICALYGALFERGNAHSIEVWDRDVLVGGLYGVALGGAFFGESMFSRRTDASKIALVHLVAGLLQGGYRLLDTQYTTSHLISLGGIGISANAYRGLLNQALTVRAVWPDDFGFEALEGVMASLRSHSGDT